MNKGIEIFSLKGKTALITGATGHLGTAMAFILAEAGAKVLINSRSHDDCSAVVQQLLDMGHDAENAQFNVSSPDEISSFAERIMGKPLHILINNAYNGGGGNIEHAEKHDYAASYDLTVGSAHSLFKATLSSLRLAVKQSGEASVINLASMYALVSPDQRMYDSIKVVNPPFYGSAKAALLQWTRYAACEFGAENIRINAISPGPFPSRIIQAENQCFIDALSTRVPLGRIGVVEDIKGPVLFLASPAASFVNGANIIVDGGWTCW